jgi:hypothetical protein
MTSDLMECLCEAGQKFMAGLLELGSVSKVKAVGYLYFGGLTLARASVRTRSITNEYIQLSRTSDHTYAAI